MSYADRLQVAATLAGVIRDIEIGLVSAVSLQQFHRPRLESVRPAFECLKQDRTLWPSLRVLRSLRDSQREVGPPRKFLEMREAARAVYCRVIQGIPEMELGVIWAAIPGGTEATVIPDYLPKPAETYQTFHEFSPGFCKCLEQLVPTLNANNRGQFSYNGATLDRSALLLRATAMEWARCNIDELLPWLKERKFNHKLPIPNLALESWRSLLSWFARTSKVFSDGFIHKLVYKKTWVGLEELPAKEKLRLIRQVIVAVNEHFDDGFVLRLHEQEETTSVQYYIERLSPDPKIEGFFMGRVLSRALRELLEQASGLTRSVLLASRQRFVDGLLDAVVELHARLSVDGILPHEEGRLLWALGASFELLRESGHAMERTDVVGSLVYRGLRQPQIRVALDRMNAIFGTSYRLVQRVKKNLAIEGEETGYFLGLPFFLGDWVVYSGQGVVQVKGVTVERILDRDQLFFYLESLNVITGKRHVIRIPRSSTAERRVRPLSSPAEMKAARRILARGKIQYVDKKQQEHQCREWFASCSLADLATAVVHLREWCSSPNGGVLWSISLRGAIRSALAQELALIEGRDPQDVLASIP